MELFGDLERLIDDIYPYRWLVAVLAALSLVLFATLAYRYGWHAALWRRKRLTALIAVPTLILVIPLSYYLLSPIWTRTTIVEESPLTVAARNNAVPGVPALQATPTLPSAAPTNTQPAATQTQQATDVPSTVETSDPVPTIEPTQESAVELTIEPEAEPTPDPTVEAVAEPTLEPAPEPEPEPTVEPTLEVFTPRLVSSGPLTGADEFHFAEGTVQLIETEPGIYVVRLESFSVRNGPDLFVYLTESPDEITDSSINLGDLRATDGSINYSVPPGTDISQYQGVVIWCRAFSVFFGSAPLIGS